MKYPAKRRIWYNNQRFDTLNIESMPRIIPNITDDNVFYQLKCGLTPFSVSVILDYNGTIMHLTNIKSIWISMSSICLSHDETMFGPTGSCCKVNCHLDITNKFVDITDSREGVKIQLITVPYKVDISDDSELVYPYTWPVPVILSTVNTDLVDEVMPPIYVYYQHDDPYMPPHLLMRVKSKIKEDQQNEHT